MKRNGVKGSGGRLREEPNRDFGAGSKDKTPNAQRPAPHAQRRVENTTAATNSRYDLEERLLEYAARIIRLVDALPSTKAGRHVADQLLRSATSPLGNHGELQGAESRKDFIHKLGLCLKEIEETWRWLRLVYHVPMLPPAKVEPLLTETKALARIFCASIRTGEKKRA
jgi:four helix bundle protein